MFLHIGADMEIMLRDIVGIFDIKSIRIQNCRKAIKYF